MHVVDVLLLVGYAILVVAYTIKMFT